MSPIARTGPTSRRAAAGPAAGGTVAELAKTAIRAASALAARPEASPREAA
jgi:hypothetical protein